MLLKNENGLTLIEALAAAVILSVVVISFLTFSEFTVFTSYKSNQLTDAQRIAEQQLNIARQHIVTTQALPTNPTVTGYQVNLQLTDLSAPGNYATTSFRKHHFSLQAIVLMSSIPRVLTVTVSWSDS